MWTMFYRDQTKKSSYLLCYINILGLFIIGLSTLFAYFSASELFGVNSFLVIGIILVISSAFIEKENRAGKIISVLILILMVAYYNLFSGDLFKTANTKDILLTWLSLGFLTGIWKLKLSNVQIKAIKFLLLLALAVLCLSYFGFRVIFPVATKVDFTGSNFIGLCAVLLAMVSLKYFDDLSTSASMTGFFCLLIAVAGTFASSSRASVIIVGVLVLVAVVPKLLNPKHISQMLVASFGVVLLFTSNFLIFDGDDGDIFSFIDGQLDHLISRLNTLDTNDVSDFQRIGQISSILNLLEENPLFLIFPLSPDSFIGVGKGFSDNSLFELAGYIGFLPSISVFVILGKRLFQQMIRLDAFIALTMLLSFNVLLWVPFAALLHMYLLAFPMPRVYPDKTF
jgi:hypothetical protein